MFEREYRDRHAEGEQGDFTDDIIQNQALERLILQAAETKIPKSELTRFGNRSFWE